MKECRSAFIVIEGLGGTGKTVLSRALAWLLQGKDVKTPPLEYSHSRRAVHGTSDPCIRFFSVLSSDAFLSERTGGCESLDWTEEGDKVAKAVCEGLFYEAF